MSLINNLNLSKGNFLNILLALFPVSFIAGNTIIAKLKKYIKNVLKDY